MKTNFADLSNEALLSNLHALVGQGHVVLARLLAYLGEVEERRLDLESACSSLYDFCIRRLGLSEDEAFRRVSAARIGRRFPVALAMIERGELHLTTLLLLREHLTENNHQELLRASAGKTKVAVQQLLAMRFPRPDVPTRVQPLPVTEPLGGGSVVPSVAESAAKRPRIEPLAPARYAIQFTATADLKEKLERATNLMMHQNTSGDLGVIVERAVDLLIADLEKNRRGKTKRPAARPRRDSTRRGYVTRAVRREVFERDGERCSFVDEAGHRCEARAFLELDHRNPRALGGSDEASNLSVKCRAHNRLAAEHDFGRTHLDNKKRERMSSPRQRGTENQAALQALTGLGFADRDARRALLIVAERWPSSEPIESVLREAIALLT